MDESNAVYEFVSKQNYISEIPYIFDKNIYEFDIRQANIHALYAGGKITQKEFEWLSLLPKMTREVEIGNMIKHDNTMYNVIKQNIADAKYQFVVTNNIPISSILRIANDSLYIICPYSSIQNQIQINGIPITFVNKNHFTTYMRLGEVLFFFNNNGEFWNIDIKGINDSKLVKHQELIGRICIILDARSYSGKETAITEFNKLYSEYINYELPICCYRELNSDSCYRVIGLAKSFNSRLLTESTPYPDFTPYNKAFELYNNKNIDIAHNQNVLRTIYKYLIES